MEAIPVKVINPAGGHLIQVDTVAHDADSSTVFLNDDGGRIENLPLWAWEHNDGLICRRLQGVIDKAGGWTDLNVDFLQQWVAEVVREAELAREERS